MYNIISSSLLGPWRPDLTLALTRFSTQTPIYPYGSSQNVEAVKSGPIKPLNSKGVQNFVFTPDVQTENGNLKLERHGISIVVEAFWYQDDRT